MMRYLLAILITVVALTLFVATVATPASEDKKQEKTVLGVSFGVALIIALVVWGFSVPVALVKRGAGTEGELKGIEMTERST